MAFSKGLIAPCGINCGVCSGFLRTKNACGGCLSVGSNLPGYCTTCKIKFCEEHETSSFTYCFQCKKFPCAKIKRLHKRYSGKYHLNLIGNSEMIRDEGFEAFLQKESVKWTCVHCGAVLCVHKEACMSCGSMVYSTALTPEGEQP